MDRTFIKYGFLFIALVTVIVGTFSSPAQAVILGETGTAFQLTAKPGTIRTGDGDSIAMYLFALAGKDGQYPGPTLIVNQGDTVSITLNNDLVLPVSLVIPGQKVTATSNKGGVPGLLTTEVPPDHGTNSVTYTFTATQPGTYAYYSGTYPEVEIEMGLVGAIIVRPAGFNPFVDASPTTVGRRAYSDISSAYDREYLMFLTEIDVDQHKNLGRHEFHEINHFERKPVTWFQNGRTFPDTVADAGGTLLPSQPYNSLPLSHPGERVLIRFVNAGLDLHPLHTHGQNHLQIARDGRVLNSTMNNDLTADLGVSDYTTTMVPGETVDAIYGPWSGGKLGWDIYGPKEGSIAAVSALNPTGINGFNRTLNWNQFLPLQAEIRPHACNATCTPGAAAFPACIATCLALPTDPNNAFCFDPVTHEYCPDHDRDFPLQLPTQTELTFGTFWGGTPFLGVPQSLPPVNTNDGLFHTQQNPGAGISFMWHSHNEREITTNNIFPGGAISMSMILPCPGGPTLCTGYAIDQYKP